jgi:hypothetical protein
LFKRTGGKIQYLILKTVPKRGEFWQPITGGLEEGETKVEALRLMKWKGNRDALKKLNEIVTK